ncbi:unnamed protein product [Symbiodinium natans]|uniref:Uncharacterized protein n=1 Tax=Symbiodinium natans TaxID=878477 RepID=A0A812SCW9_9DINO|nr:unnamed protein product [Symbiodinium natans]
MAPCGSWGFSYGDGESQEPEASSSWGRSYGSYDDNRQYGQSYDGDRTAYGDRPARQYGQSYDGDRPARQYGQSYNGDRPAYVSWNIRTAYTCV